MLLSTLLLLFPELHPEQLRETLLLTHARENS